MRILIADDDLHVRTVVADVVTDLGYTATLAQDGEEAWRAFQEHGADVVVSDWLMPGLDGPELCRRVRSASDAPYTYVILLTALGDQHRVDGIRAGADDYLPKPFRYEDIEARLLAAERVVAVHRRGEVLLRQTRRFAAEDDPTRLLEALLDEAVRLVHGGAAGVVSRWDEASRSLVPLASTGHVSSRAIRALQELAAARAARERLPVLLDRTAALAVRIRRGVVAVPLLYEGRLLGVLAVGRLEPHGPALTREHVELLEALASTAAAALAALERARLDGVMLAARTAQHELNNQLAVARGYAELLVTSSELPPHLADLAGEVMRAADDAARIVRQLRSVAHIREQRWSDPRDTTLDLSGPSTTTAA